MTAAQLRSTTINVRAEAIACVEMPDGDVRHIRATSTYTDPKTRQTYLILSTEPEVSEPPTVSERS